MGAPLLLSDMLKQDYVQVFVRKLAESGLDEAAIINKTTEAVMSAFEATDPTVHELEQWKPSVLSEIVERSITPFLDDLNKE